MAVIGLLLFALGRLNESYQKWKRGEVGLIRGLLIPLIVFAAIYRTLIRPMIGKD